MKYVKVILALIVVGLIVAACGGNAPAAPTTAPGQAPTVPLPTLPPPLPTNTPAPAPTPVPPTPTPKPQPPSAELVILPVAANRGSGVDPGDPNVMTTTIKMMTDTVAGPYSSVIGLGAPGLTNHPLNVPVHVNVNDLDAKNPAKKIAWTLTAPTGSKAKILAPDKAATEFTPDVVGMYKIDVVLSNDAGSSAMQSEQIHVGTYVGVDAGNCKQCHPNKVAEWAKTGHATRLTTSIDEKPSHYNEGCIRCHTTGYYPGANNGGFADVQAKLGWQFPTLQQIEAGGNWDKMPAELKNMANIQCEDCHGPAKEHVTTGAPVMATSFDEGTCNVCHNGGGNHLKGTDLKSAAHSNADAAAFNDPIGPSRQACVRCHSGKGYASFIADPNNQASWTNEKQTITCTACHDPHSDANPFQLRIAGQAVALPFKTTTDYGLSATCVECHNSRVTPAGAVNSSFPHYSSAADLISNVAGVDYGQKIFDSPHGEMVGSAPIPNPDFAKDPTTNQFMFSKVGDTKGNTPGACVVCHMWPTITDQKDPNWHKVGSHSFNTSSPDGTFDYTASCQQCHGKDITTTFNIKAKADYDGNGKVEGVQDEVKGMLGVLWKALEDKGVKKVDSGYPYMTLPQNADNKIKNAIYNYRTVYGVMWGVGEDGKPTAGGEGKAAAIHNFKRSIMLLQLSYKDLTGQDVPNAASVTEK